MHTAIGHVQAGQRDRAASASEQRGQRSHRHRLQRVHSLARIRGQHRVREAIQKAHTARSRATGTGQSRLRRVQGGLCGGDEADARGGGQAQKAAQSAGQAGHTGRGAAEAAE